MLLSYVPAEKLREVACIFPELFPPHRPTFRSFVDWTGLCEQLGRFPKLERFRVFHWTVGLPRKFGDFKFEKWARQCMPELEAAGKLCFERI